MPQSTSVTLSVSQAVYRVKRLLFEPFDLTRWLVIGFCAWLAELGRGGFGAGFKLKGGNPAAIAAKVQQSIEQSRNYALLHLWWIVPLAATVALLALAFWGLVLWVSSRGQFMFLHCVALDKAEVRVPWAQYARQAHSLFLFRLVLTLLALVFTFPTVIGFIIFLVPLLSSSGVAATIVAILAAIALGLLVIMFTCVWVIVSKLTTDFVVPIQLVRGCRCREAWTILIELISRNVGDFVLYLLFQIVLWIAIYAALTVIVVLTCCIAGCLLALP